MLSLPPAAALALLLAHAAATWFMVGLIWTVQVVHYPLMSAVGAERFVAYEAAHVRRISWVVIPPMLLELGCAVALAAGAAPAVPVAEALLGLGLVGGIWASTFLLQVPEHARLEQGFDPASHRRLVRSNLIRTALWTARGGLALAWLAQSVA